MTEFAKMVMMLDRKTPKNLDILSEIQKLEVFGGASVSDIGFHSSCTFVLCYNLSCVNGVCTNDGCSNGYCNNTGKCEGGFPTE